MVQRQAPIPAVASDPAALDPGERYEYHDKERVLVFLAEHPEFVAILREAGPEIAQRFGASTTITLMVDNTMEIGDEDTLWGYIGTSLPPREALDRLRRLDDEYWIERSTGINELLALNLRFVG